MTTHRDRSAWGAVLLPLVLVGCATGDTLLEARALGRAGLHGEAISTLDRAAAASSRPEPLRAEILRQQELQAMRLIDGFNDDLRAGRFDAARAGIAELESASPRHPRLAALREQLSISQRHAGLVSAAAGAAAAGRPDEARRLLMRVLGEAPTNAGARRLIAELPPPEPPVDPERGAADGLPAALRRPVTVEFREATLRNVFETLARMAQVNFVFDRDVRSDARITVFLREVSLDEAVRTILQTQTLAMRRLNETTYLVFPGSAAKAREYVPLEARGFWLSNIDVKQAAQLVRSVVKSRDLFVDDKLNMLVVKDTPDAVRLVAQLLRSIDVPDPEVVLEIEVLEIARSRLQELGIRFPNQIAYGLLAPGGGGSVVVPGIVTRAGWGDQVVQVANPSLIANLRDTDGSVNLLSNPRVRVRNREKARIQVGEKVPVFTTQFAATGVGTSNAIGASTTYIDVGLKVEVEPQVHADDEVAMKVQLEVSNILEQVSGPAQTTAYRIGTRQAQTVLRLRDGETQVLAGLIQDADRLTSQRVPGLGSLPLIGRLFSNQLSQAEKTEIILMITPRIVRPAGRSPGGDAAMAAGTEAAAGVAPLSLSPRAQTRVGPGSGSPTARAGPTSAEPAAVAPIPAQPATTGEGGAPARVVVQAPASVRAGQEFTVVVSLEGGVPAGGGEVDVDFDGRAFALPAQVVMNESGRATVALQSGSGAPVGRLNLRASPAGVTAGRIDVRAVRARRADGGDLGAIDLPPPVVVTIQP